MTSAYLKNDLDKFMDAIGDVFIAITIFCQQESLKVMEFYYPAEYCADFNQALNRLILSNCRYVHVTIGILNRLQIFWVLFLTVLA